MALVNNVTVKSSDLTLVNAEVSGYISRTSTDFFAQELSVKDFGAKGDYNVATGTGTDDTAAINNLFSYLGTLGNIRNGGKVIVRFPAGVYRIDGTLNLPLGIDFGIEVIGDGSNCTHLRFLNTVNEPGITCGSELTRISGLYLWGTQLLSPSGIASRRQAPAVRAYNQYGSADVDLNLDHCSFNYFNIGALVVGRGVVADNCVFGFMDSAVTIDLPSSINWAASGNNTLSQYTGARHYTLRNNRFDNCSKGMVFTGNSTANSYISDVLITGNDILIMDILLQASTSTIRRSNISTNNAVYSFASGVIQVRDLHSTVISGNNFSKGYDDFNAFKDPIRTLVTATGYISGVTVSNNVIRGLSYSLLSMSSGNDITVSANVLPHIWSIPEQSNKYFVFSSTSIPRLSITGNTFQLNVAASGTYNMYGPSQTSSATVVQGNVSNISWSTSGIPFSPVLTGANGTWSSTGYYTLDNGWVQLDFVCSGTGVSTSSGNVLISLPLPSTPLNSGISGIAGTGSVGIISGFNRSGSGSVQLRAVGQSLELYRISDLVPTQLTWDFRNSTSVILHGSIRYRATGAV